MNCNLVVKALTWLLQQTSIIVFCEISPGSLTPSGPLHDSLAPEKIRSFEVLPCGANWKDHSRKTKSSKRFVFKKRSFKGDWCVVLEEVLRCTSSRYRLCHANVCSHVAILALRRKLKALKSTAISSASAPEKWKPYLCFSCFERVSIVNGTSFNVGFKIFWLGWVWQERSWKTISKAVIGCRIF